MKKIISFTLALVMVLALAGCGQKSVDYDEKSGENESKGITEQNNETDSGTGSSASVEIEYILCTYDIHEEDSKPSKITDGTEISELIETLLEIEWTPKTEGDWPKYSVNHPNHSIEIGTVNQTFLINLFDDRFVAVMTDENWKRYEISQADYENLEQSCRYIYEEHLVK